MLSISKTWRVKLDCMGCWELGYFRWSGPWRFAEILPTSGAQKAFQVRSLDATHIVAFRTFPSVLRKPRLRTGGWRTARPFCKSRTSELRVWHPSTNGLIWSKGRRCNLRGYSFCIFATDKSFYVRLWKVPTRFLTSRVIKSDAVNERLRPDPYGRRTDMTPGVGVGGGPRQRGPFRVLTQKPSRGSRRKNIPTLEYPIKSTQKKVALSSCTKKVYFLTKRGTIHPSIHPFTGGWRARMQISKPVVTPPRYTTAKDESLYTRTLYTRQK